MPTQEAKQWNKQIWLSNLQKPRPALKLTKHKIESIETEKSEGILTFPSDLTLIDSVVVEDFDAVCAVVRNEDLLTVVNHDAVREFKVFRAAEFVQDIAHLKNKIIHTASHI